MNDKVREIPTQPDKVKAAGEVLARNLHALIANAPLVAKLKKAQYDAYIAEGFTPQQALELIKNI
ncbi:MAG: hypothetical protein ACPHN2_08630 [Sinimarinibacterium flocculans]|uniref:hypothetical protein n=1 Tax=Sinimarinibacterium flocculans TaxID=985250 RepID=UPI003C684D38